jgi:hypothetical protein
MTYVPETFQRMLEGTYPEPDPPHPLCDEHGQMRWRPKILAWICNGFDGELCPVLVRLETLMIEECTGGPSEYLPGEWLGSRPGSWHLGPAPG